MVLDAWPIIGEERPVTDERTHGVAVSTERAHERVKAVELHIGQGRLRHRIGELPGKRLTRQRQRLRRADHQRAPVPQRGMGKDVQERPHDQSILHLGTLPNPLQQDTALGKRLPGEGEILPRVQHPAPACCGWMMSAVITS